MLTTRLVTPKINGLIVSPGGFGTLDELYIDILKAGSLPTPMVVHNIGFKLY